MLASKEKQAAENPEKYSLFSQILLLKEITQFPVSHFLGKIIFSLF